MAAVAATAPGGEGQAQPHGKERMAGGGRALGGARRGRPRHGPQFQGWKLFYQVRRKHIAPTVMASTLVTGLTPVTLYASRFRTLTVAGFSDWSAAVTFIAR